MTTISKTDDQNFFLRKSTIYLILSHFIIVMIFAFTRLVDVDEGFYLIAAQEVWNGRTLYIDFFFPQMPYIPYFFSPISGHGFTTLFIARIIGVVFSLFTIILFTRIVCKITINNSVRTTLLFLYAFNALIITWHPTAKTYMFTDFFLIFSFLSFLYYLKTKSTKMIIATAVSIAFAVNFRSVFAPLILFYAILIYLNSPQAKLKNITLYIISVLVISIPTLYLIYLSPDHFMFDNIGFHMIRNDWVGLNEGILSRLYTFGKLLITPQILIIIIILISKYIYSRKSENKSLMNWHQSPSILAGIIAITITFIYLLPKPILQQYFLQAVPFALIVSIKGLEYFFSESKLEFWRITKDSITKIISIVYILGLVPYIFVFIFGIREYDGSHTIKNMSAMCSYIEFESENKLIMSEWPAIPLLAEVSNLDGLEFLGFEFPLPLTPEDSKKYHLALDNDIRDDIERDMPDFIVVKYDPAIPLRPVINELYKPDTSFGAYNLFRKK